MKQRYFGTATARLLLGLWVLTVALPAALWTPRGDFRSAAADNILSWEGVRPPYAPAIGTSAPYASLAKYGAAADLIAGALPPAHPIAVAPNGDVFTAGRAAPGGRPVVYKSSDGGRSWNQTSSASGLPLNTVVTGLAVAPQYPAENIVFAAFSDGAAGAAGNGVAISTDGGAAFNVLASFGASGFNMALADGLAIAVRDGVPFNVTTVAVSPDFDDHSGSGLVVLAGNAASGGNGADAVYQLDLNPGGAVNTAAGTATGPVRWSGGTSFTGGAVTSLALAFSPQYPADGVIGLLYSCGGSGSGRCAIGSGTFVALTAGGVLASAAGGEIAASDRLGAAGFVAATGGLAFPADYDASVAGSPYFAATGNGPPAGIGDIYRRGAGGWTPLSRTADFSALAVAGSGAAARLLAAVDSTGLSQANAVHVSAGAGQSFTVAALDGEKQLRNVSGGVNRLALAPDFLTSGVAYGTLPGALGGVVRTADYGASWADTGLANERYNQISAIASFSAAAPAGYIVMTDGANRSLWRTDRLGPNAAWVRIHRAPGSGIVYLVPPDVKAAATLYAFNPLAASAMILKSADGGRTWDALADPFVDASVTALDAASANRLLAGDSKGRVWNSADGGVSWTPAAAALGQRVTGFRLLPDFAGSGAVAAAAIAGSSPEVYLSTDGGAHFTQTGASQGAWGQTSSPAAGLSIASDGQYPTNRTLYVRCDACSDTDLWRITPDGANPGAWTVTRVGVPASIRPLGHHTLVDAPGGGAALYLMGADPATPDPGAGSPACTDAFVMTPCTGSNMQWRSFAPASLSEAAWSRLAAMSPPVAFPIVPGGPPTPARVAGAVSDVLAGGGAVTWWYGANDPASAAASAAAITQIMSITWPGDFLTPVSLTSPAAGAVIPGNSGDRGAPAALLWQPVSRAQCYDVQVALDPEFTQLAVDATGAAGACPADTAGVAANPSLTLAAAGNNSTTVAVLPLIEGAPYYWRARVRSVGPAAPGALAPGPWSPARSFLVAGQSRLTVSPGAGEAGADLALEGAFFAPGETVEVRWDNPGALLGAPAAGPDGRIALAAAVPVGAPAGAHIIRAVGASSGKSAAAGFTVGAPTPPGALILRGTAALQVMGAPATDPSENRWANYPLTLTFYQAGTGVAAWAGTAATDRLGAFTLTGAGFPAGVYDVKIKGAHTLSNQKRGLALPQAAGAPPIDFGTLRAGDLSSDDRMGADDYSMLVTNFALGPGPVTLAAAQHAGARPVRLTVGPGPGFVEAGAVIALNLRLETGSQPVDSVSAALLFPPHLLQAVTPAGAAARQLQEGRALPVVLVNEVDNGAGRALFAAGRLPQQTAQDDLTAATIFFRALEPLNGPLPIILGGTGDLTTAVYYRGARVDMP